MECGHEVVVCICGRPLSFVGGWDGRSSSPVGLPALWVILLWSFGGLPFVGSGEVFTLPLVFRPESHLSPRIPQDSSRNLTFRRIVDGI